LRAEHLGQFVGERRLIVLVLTFDEILAVDQLAQALPELRFHGSDRQEAAVGARVDPVASKLPGQGALALAVQAMRCKAVGVMGHRHGDVAAATTPLALEQRRHDLDDGVQRTTREVRDLHRRQRGRGVFEQPGPPGVVQIVSRPSVTRAEAGDRAVHDGLRHIACADAEPLCDTGAKALEYDVRTRTQRASECGVTLQIPDNGLLPRIQRGVPGGRNVAQRIAGGRLDPDDARAALEKLAACKRPGKVAREVRYEDPGECLHYAAYID
jgi:hypothetical protein